MSNSVCKENLHSSGPATDSRFMSVNDTNVLTFSHLEQIGSLLVEHRTPLVLVSFTMTMLLLMITFCVASPSLLIQHSVPLGVLPRQGLPQCLLPALRLARVSLRLTRRVCAREEGSVQVYPAWASGKNLIPHGLTYTARGAGAALRRTASCAQSARKKKKKNMCRQAPPKTP